MVLDLLVSYSRKIHAENIISKLTSGTKTSAQRCLTVYIHTMSRCTLPFYVCKKLNADDCRLKPVVRESKQTDQSETDLASIVVDDEALIPAVEVFMGVDLDSELLQHRLVGPLAHGMHGGTNIIQDAHDARRILGITVNFRFLICYSLKIFFYLFLSDLQHMYTQLWSYM